MDATTALEESNQLLNGLIAGLTPDDRETRTPCDEWNVHELVEHICSGTHGIAGGLAGQAPPEEMPDFMAEGPANAWAEAYNHLTSVATPEVLTALHAHQKVHDSGNRIDFASGSRQSCSLDEATG